MSYAVIQGSSRGIGLALTRHLLKNTNLNVINTTSSSNTSSARSAVLKGLESNGKKPDERLTTLTVDVTNEESVESASKEIKEKFGKDMRLLVNVSGMLHPEKSLSEVTLSELTKSFQINTFGHLLVYKHFVSLIPSRKARHAGETSSIFGDKDEDGVKGLLPSDKATLVSLSARVGSIGDNQKGGWYSYRSSKAATNQIIRTLSHELNMRSIPAACYAYHPGTVQTELAKDYVSKEPDPEHGLFTPEMAAEKFFDVLGGGKWTSGGFVDWGGNKVEW